MAENQQMKIDQYLVTVRIDVVRRNKKETPPECEMISRTLDDYAKRHYLFDQVETIQSEYIGTSDATQE